MLITLKRQSHMIIVLIPVVSFLPTMTAATELTMTVATKMRTNVHGSSVSWLTVAVVWGSNLRHLSDWVLRQIVKTGGERWIPTMLPDCAVEVETLAERWSPTMFRDFSPLWIFTCCHTERLIPINMLRDFSPEADKWERRSSLFNMENFTVWNFYICSYETFIPKKKRHQCSITKWKKSKYLINQCTWKMKYDIYIFICVFIFSFIDVLASLAFKLSKSEWVSDTFSVILFNKSI